MCRGGEQPFALSRLCAHAGPLPHFPFMHRIPLYAQKRWGNIVVKPVVRSQQRVANRIKFIAAAAPAMALAQVSNGQRADMGRRWSRRCDGSSGCAFRLAIATPPRAMKPANSDTTSIVICRHQAAVNLSL
jgi:hypothetical protein